jgi:hypothetical protein
MDLRDAGTSKELNMHYSFQGDKESFPCNTLSDTPSAPRQPRFFSIGTETVSITTQLSIAKHVTGDEFTLNQEMANRQKSTGKHGIWVIQRV